MCDIYQNSGKAMSGLSSALIVIFVLTITSLAALYFFVTRHQRRFRRQSRLATATATDQESTTTNDSVYYVPSKELLYFFWWNNQTGQVRNTPQRTVEETRPDPSAPADIEIDFLKLIAALQGHTRSPLFTIVEEQKTETGQPNDKVPKSDNRTSLSSSEGDIIGRLSLAGSFGHVEGSAAADVADPVIASDEEEEEEEEEEEVTTPNFTTPNASPPYHTPSDSPLHDHSNIDSTFHVHNFTANSRGRRGFRRSRRRRAGLQAKGDDDKAAPPCEEEKPREGGSD